MAAADGNVVEKDVATGMAACGCDRLIQQESRTGVGGVRSRTATKKYYADLRNSFSELHFQVHENIGVLVENDLVALRTIVTGVHTGDYADVPATGRQIQTSVSHAKAVDARSDNCNRCPRRRSHRPRPPKTASGAELTTIALPQST
jgi:predicted ester cyclase